MTNYFLCSIVSIILLCIAIFSKRKRVERNYYMVEPQKFYSLEVKAGEKDLLIIVPAKDSSIAFNAIKPFLEKLFPTEYQQRKCFTKIPQLIE
jgi:hypothetical protein